MARATCGSLRDLSHPPRVGHVTSLALAPVWCWLGSWVNMQDIARGTGSVWGTAQ